MRPTQSAMTEIARRVLDGEESYAQLRERDRFTQVYVFVAMMLVRPEEYFEPSSLSLKKNLRVSLGSFVGGDDELGGALGRNLNELGLKALWARARHLTLEPPEELKNLTHSYTPESPGVVAFFEAVAAAKQARIEQRKREAQEHAAERAAQLPIETAGDALLTEIFADQEGGRIFAERILWELYSPAAQRAAAKIAEAPKEVQLYIARVLVSKATDPYNY